MTENVETTFQKVFRVIVKQEDITIPVAGINPKTPLFDIFGSTTQPLWAGFKFFMELRKAFVEQEYFFGLSSLDYNANNELKTVGDLVDAIDAQLLFSRERRTRARTFERVRMNALKASNNRDLNLREVTTTSTLEELDLEGMLGAVDFFDNLMEDFQTDHPDFNLDVDDWIGIKTIGEAVNLVEKKLGKVPA